MQGTVTSKSRDGRTKTSTPQRVAKRPQSWQRVDALRVQQNIATDDVPEGAFTVYDYEDRYSVGKYGAREQLRKLERAGKIKSGIAVVGRTRRRTRFYWPV